MNPATGEVRPFHRFVPPLPRQAVLAAVCDTCDNPVQTHQGPVVAWSYAFPLREVAAAFVAVGTGASYYRAADRARTAAGRPRLDGDHGGAVVAEWLDAFGPGPLEQYAEREWPETLVLDSTRFMVENRRTGRRQLAFNVFGAYGYPARGRGRVWALRASHRATAVEWEQLLRSLDTTVPPRFAVTDDAPEIANAVRAVWPKLPGPSFAQPFLLRCEHHLHENGAELMAADGWAGWNSFLRRRLDTAFRREEGWQELNEKAVGFPATTAWLSGIQQDVGVQVGVRHLLPGSTRPPPWTLRSAGSATSSTPAPSSCATPTAPTCCSDSSVTTSMGTTWKLATGRTCGSSPNKAVASRTGNVAATTHASTLVPAQRLRHPGSLRV